ncbi:MAG: dihydrodipicolinate synthase family protein, partial [Candidatus Hydrogenedentes bacterium]|nr:dihydrodipicolinate synthase family protein [Candidatus Hydrogenedentota bacterium]
MIPEFVRGAIAPVFTAFNEDGTFDEAGQRNLLDFLLERGGISAFFLRSGMGQMYTFSYEDTEAIARTACSHLAGTAPALVGTTGIWDRDRTRRPNPAVFTQQAIELSR